MNNLRIGVDIDGCLADFNTSFQKKIVEATGVDLFAGENFQEVDPPTWGYPKHYGYTNQQESQAWEAVKADPMFWANLGCYPFVTDYIAELVGAKLGGHDIYFITTRPGVAPKLQSEYWLERCGYAGPTVLIAANAESKGLLAKGLGLTHFIDDRPENCFAVKGQSPATQVFLLARRYNIWAQAEARDQHIEVISSVNQFIEEIFHAQETVPSLAGS
jgi:hypothetical protein